MPTGSGGKEARQHFADLAHEVGVVGLCASIGRGSARPRGRRRFGRGGTHRGAGHTSGPGRGGLDGRVGGGQLEEPRR